VALGPPVSTSRREEPIITAARQRVGRAVLATVGAFALALGMSSTARAHAALVGTTPSDGSVLERAPERVVLRFDEPVSTVAGSVRVFDSRAQRVDTGEIEKPSAREVAGVLPANLPEDTYTVAWRVLSADSHPVRGAFVFSVGRPADNAAGVADQVLDTEAGSAAVDWLLAVARFAGLALILLCVGGVAVAVFVADAGHARAAGLWLVLAGAGGLLAVGSAALICLTAAQAAGFGLGGLFRWGLVRDVLETGFGQVWVARGLLALALVALALLAHRGRKPRPDSLLMFVASAIAVTPALSGHARVAGTLAIVSDGIHVVTAGLWVGGLAFISLLLVKAGGDRWSLAMTAVPRFSVLAVGSVVGVSVAGITSGVLEVRYLAGLWETTYGQLLLAKTALVIPLLALGAFNNRIAVPRLRAAAAGAQLHRRFARVVALELTLMAAIVGVTSVLAAEPPAKTQLGPSRPVSREGRIGPYRFTLTVDPARVGPNEIHVYLLDSTGQLAPVEEIDFAATLPAVDLGPLRFKATRAGPGHGLVPGWQPPLSGDWRLQLSVRKGEFDRWSTTIVLPIGEDS
jgi:copper transport protein